MRWFIGWFSFWDRDMFLTAVAVSYKKVNNCLNHLSPQAIVLDAVRRWTNKRNKMGNFADDDACKDRIQFTGDTRASQTRGKFSAIFSMNQWLTTEIHWRNDRHLNISWKEFWIWQWMCSFLFVYLTLECLHSNRTEATWGESPRGTNKHPTQLWILHIPGFLVVCFRRVRHAVHAMCR